MRYSIIHHDVREHFNLTISEYLVCDSIHQLSHSAPTKKTVREIGEFIGVDFSHVSSLIRKLEEKALVLRTELGLQTTEEWGRSVTFAVGKSHKNGENPTKTGKIPQDTTICNNSNNITSEIGISPVEDEVETTRELLDSEGNSLNPEKPQKRESRTKDKLAAFSLFSLKDAGWKYHPAQRAAALRLFDRGLEKVAAGLKVMREHEDDQTCPQASTPLEYEKKQPSLVRYVQRIGK